MTTKDSVTIGLTQKSHSSLQLLKDEGVFSEMMDGYRFAIALSVQRRLLAPKDISTETIFNVGSLDRDGLIRDLVVSVFPEAKERPYTFVERLAEAGIEELMKLYDSRQLRFSDLFETHEAVSNV